MAQITASQVKVLREQTGVGMMDCKKALQECDGDIKRAAQLLREKGAAKAIKRAGRATREGRIEARLSDDKRVGALSEVNIETDFAARNDSFVALANTVCDTVLAEKCETLDALLAAKPVGSDVDNVQTLVQDVQTVIGENMAVGRCACVSVAEGQAGLIHTYIHPPGKIGVAVSLACETDAVAAAPQTEELAHDLCLQIAFSNPVSIDSSSIDPEVIATEREVYRNAALKQGKPEKILDKIVDGRLKGFFKESCLIEQAFVKEEKKSVSQLIAETAKTVGGSIEIVRFERFQLGVASGDAE